MSFFWPTYRNPDPGIFARLGRLLHWSGAVLAVISFAIGIAAAFNEAGYTGPIFGALAAAFFYFPARGLRYFLAGE